MKLHEAIEALMLPDNDYKWIRPVSWQGGMQAFCLSCDKTDTLCVPGNGGGRSYMSSSTFVLMDDWEIVDPDVVLRGD
jgi:hypothetical protein